MILSVVATLWLAAGVARAETTAEGAAPGEDIAEPEAPPSLEAPAVVDSEPAGVASPLPEPEAERALSSEDAEAPSAPEAAVGALAEPAIAAPAREEAPARRERPYGLRAVGEVGFLAVLDHRIQFGTDGTYLDYREQGAQDTLFLNGRISLELGLFRHHQIIFLYQPLSLETEDVLEEQIRVDGLDYPAGTPTRFIYDFPFYRLSYLYDFFSRRDLEVAIGLTAQIRNTTISFASRDGTLYRTERDVGFVPALKLRVTYHFPFGLWLGAEIDGMYAPVSVLNGSDEEITGAILDASLRAGLVLPRDVQIFLNVRYLGGGAVGTDEDDRGPGDGYVRNWLHFLTVTLGVTWDIL